MNQIINSCTWRTDNKEIELQRIIPSQAIYKLNFQTLEDENNVFINLQDNPLIKDHLWNVQIIH